MNTDSAEQSDSESNGNARVNAVIAEPAYGANSVRLTGKNNKMWIIDRGASTHVTGVLSLFES